jgi:methanethiol S-methyltransferase
MKRLSIFVYGVLCYTASLATLLYTVAFLGNVWVRKSLDSPGAAPLATTLLIDVALVTLFAVQHSVMARPAFKRWWTRIVPEPAERSTYMLFSCLALVALFHLWQPVGGLIWDVTSPIGRALLYGVFALGWAVLLLSTFLLNHFDLFGLRQVWLQLTGKPYQSLPFGTPVLYRYVRHPLYVGWLLTFWAAPTMTVAHLLFALASSIYILIAIRFEERDLMDLHPQYQSYRRRVPMLLPFTKVRTQEATQLAPRG